MRENEISITDYDPDSKTIENWIKNNSFDQKSKVAVACTCGFSRSAIMCQYVESTFGLSCHPANYPDGSISAFRRRGIGLSDIWFKFCRDNTVFIRDFTDKVDGVIACYDENERGQTYTDKIEKFVPVLRIIGSETEIEKFVEKTSLIR